MNDAVFKRKEMGNSVDEDEHKNATQKNEVKFLINN